MFKDWALDKGYNLVDIVRAKHRIGYPKALDRIHQDLDKFSKNSDDKAVGSSFQSLETKRKIVQAKVQPWTPAALDYWTEYGITQKTLNLFDVHNVKYLYIDKVLKWRATERNPIFAYKLSDTGIKVYRPLSLSSSCKWRSSCTSKDVHGLDYVKSKPSKLLIVTSSGKDAMVLTELGYKAIAPHAEGTLIPIDARRDLQKMFPEIIIFMDSDAPGMKYNIKHSRSFGNVPYLVIPEKYQVKDISDFMKKYGKEKTKRLMKKLISGAYARSNSLSSVPY